MKLKFLGKGAGFSKEHTSAYFFTDNRLVIIDLSLLNEKKLENMDLSEYDEFIILVTHTHSDHISGLGLWVQYATFVLKKKVIIVAPSERVEDDILYLLRELEGNDSSWYTLTNATKFRAPWFGVAIPTLHSPQLAGKCFGYRLNIEGTNVIYTGDTSSLKAFTPYLTQGCEFYVDVSVHYGSVHLKLLDVLHDLRTYAQKGVHVYLMHLDDPEVADIMTKDIPNIELA